MDAESAINPTFFVAKEPTRMTAKNLLDILGLIFLFVCGSQVLATLKAYGSLPTRAVVVMTRTSLRGSKVFILLNSIIWLLVSIFRPLIPDWVPPFPPLLVVGTVLIGLSAACLPPAILYLASSTAKGISLGNDLQSTVEPLKLINFLESFHAHASLAERENIEHTSYRVGSRWEKMVMAFCEFVPLIIVDTRVMTAPILAEINFILTAGLEKQTIFVAEPNRVDPILIAMSNMRQREIQVSTHSELVFALRRIGFKTLVSGQQNFSQSVINRLEAQGALLIR